MFCPLVKVLLSNDSSVLCFGQAIALLSNHEKNSNSLLLLHGVGLLYRYVLWILITQLERVPPISFSKKCRCYSMQNISLSWMICSCYPYIFEVFDVASHPNRTIHHNNAQNCFLCLVSGSQVNHSTRHHYSTGYFYD